ncbi:unnamed protein product [Gongylonema pulchrum]|uniref:Transcriptional regulator n=1 Tax=Gongylonema pulchrum TaxID=637853 RepID=A0A183DCN3_9BILA|nr:unnamed protein product [Gongylonema pulchrum]
MLIKIAALVYQSTEGAALRVWQVLDAADDAEFGHKNASVMMAMPKLYLWQWNKTFNQSGTFAITDSILQDTVEPGIEASPRTMQNGLSDDGPSVSSSAEQHDSKSTSSSALPGAALNLLLEILNDWELRDLVIEKHQTAFENYIQETISGSNSATESP